MSGYILGKCEQNYSYIYKQGLENKIMNMFLLSKMNRENIVLGNKLKFEMKMKSLRCSG